MQFISQFFTSWFLCCGSNLDLQGNLPRLGAWLISLTNFFLCKMLEIFLEYWKLSKLCFIIEKTLGLLRLYVKVKRIISSFLVVFCYLKSSRGISLALKMLAPITRLRVFLLYQYSVQFLKASFFLHFHFQQWYILFLQEITVYSLKNT